MTRSAAIVTIGTELTEGLRVDTNTAEIALALSARGFDVAEAVSVGDDAAILSASLRRLVSAYELVVVTGGLGPTHDDITREAASDALSRPLVRDERMVRRLQPLAAHYAGASPASQIFRQADVIEGAEVIEPTTGSAPGQIAQTPAGLLALLPGPPKEMRGMLARVLERAGGQDRAAARDLAVTGMTESAAQMAAQGVLGERSDVQLTVLARPGDVRVLLLDRGAGAAVLDELAEQVAVQLGDGCYSASGETLPQALVREASARGVTVACAESCTGGMVCAAITDVPGSSAVLRGGVVAYSNDAKMALLGVAAETLREHGAVSRETAAEMAAGASRALAADITVSVTGIAGPDGGTAEKPVGLVWFGVHSTGVTPPFQVERRFLGDREGVRVRATTFALDLLRREVLKR